jgi:hypothetical protein
MQFKIYKKNYSAVLSGNMYPCYFSVYTSIYLCCSFWYRFESSLLIKGSLICFTLAIYNLSINFRNWTKIYNKSINLKCFNNIKAIDEHFVYFRTNPFTERTIFFEKHSHSMYRPELHPKFRQFMISILKRLHLIFVLFCYFLFFLVLNFTQLNQA